MHKIMEKPIISYIILFVVFYVLQMTIESFLRQALINITPLYGDAISSIISVAVIAIIYILIFKFNKMFSLKNFKLGFILIIPTFAYALINVFNPGFGAGSVETLIAVILLGFSIGLCEEVLFRGILISNLMKLIKNKDKIFIIVIAQALVFGLIHIANAIFGADPVSTLLQVFYAIGLGILFGAIYLRTGNLWAPIISHSVIDIFALVNTSTNGGLLPQMNITNIILSIVVGITAIAIGLYYVRPSKHTKILEVWEEKWTN